MIQIHRYKSELLILSWDSTLEQSSRSVTKTIHMVLFSKVKNIILWLNSPLQPDKFSTRFHIKEVCSYQFSNTNIWWYCYVVDILQQESSVIEKTWQRLERLDLFHTQKKNHFSSLLQSVAMQQALQCPYSKILNYFQFYSGNTPGIWCFRS